MAAEARVHAGRRISRIDRPDDLLRCEQGRPGSR